jgi:hypothetical protein
MQILARIVLSVVHSSNNLHATDKTFNTLLGLYSSPYDTV